MGAVRHEKDRRGDKAVSITVKLIDKHGFVGDSVVAFAERSKLEEVGITKTAEIENRKH